MQKTKTLKEQRDFSVKEIYQVGKFQEKGTFKVYRPCARCGKLVVKYGLRVFNYETEDLLPEDQFEAICFDCCALNDKEWMDNHDRMILYLNEMDKTIKQDRLDRAGGFYFKVINWPETLRFTAIRYKFGITRLRGKRLTRLDVWFWDHKNRWWWGKRIGENDIVYCRKLKHSPLARLKNIQILPDISCWDLKGEMK